MHQLWAQNNPYIFNVNYQFSLFHSIQYLSQYNKAKGTIFFKRDYYVLSSDWRIIGLDQDIDYTLIHIEQTQNAYYVAMDISFIHWDLVAVNNLLQLIIDG
jgi:hypothetical protein